jgi:hypothetical protein
MTAYSVLLLEPVADAQRHRLGASAPSASTGAADALPPPLIRALDGLRSDDSATFLEQSRQPEAGE